MTNAFDSAFSAKAFDTHPHRAQLAGEQRDPLARKLRIQFELMPKGDSRDLEQFTWFVPTASQ